MQASKESSFTAILTAKQDGGLNKKVSSTATETIKSSILIKSSGGTNTEKLSSVPDQRAAKPIPLEQRLASLSLNQEKSAPIAPKQGEARGAVRDEEKSKSMLSFLTKPLDGTELPAAPEVKPKAQRSNITSLVKPSLDAKTPEQAKPPQPPAAHQPSPQLLSPSEMLAKRSKQPAKTSTGHAPLTTASESKEKADALKAFLLPQADRVDYLPLSPRDLLKKEPTTPKISADGHQDKPSLVPAAEPTNLLKSILAINKPSASPPHPQDRPSKVDTSLSVQKDTAKPASKPLVPSKVLIKRSATAAATAEGKHTS